MKNKPRIRVSLPVLSLAERIRRSLALAVLFLIGVAAPVLAQSPPQQFTATFTNGGTTITVNFERHSIRDSNFSVVVQDDDGNLNPYTAKPYATYLGTPAGRPGGLACAAIEPDGVTLRSFIIFEDGLAWEGTTPLSGGSVWSGGDANWTKMWPTFTIGSGGAGSSIYAANSGVDAAWRYFEASGFDKDRTIFGIEHSILKTNAIYLRDASIVHRIGRIVIRGSQSKDPYETAPWWTIGDQWNNVLPPSGHDLALLVTPNYGGGIAYKGSVGTANPFSANQSSGGDFCAAWRHEVGHNWGSDHRESNTSEGPTIVSGNSLARITTGELTLIVGGRNSAAWTLNNLGPYGFPLPPRASMDIAEVPEQGSVIIDVLANDHDGNGNAISILDFDTTSTRATLDGKRCL